MIYQRTGGQNIDSPVQHRPSLSVGGSSRERESPPRADVATALSHPCHRRVPRPPPVLPGEPAGLAPVGTAGPGLGWGPGRLRHVPCRRGPQRSRRYPLLQLNLPREGGARGEEERLGSPIKFYTSLHCFSGCFQNQKTQEIYSQMFPCLFVDSV